MWFAWNGSRTGERGPGGALVEARVRSTLGGPAVVRLGTKTARIETKAGHTLTLDAELRVKR
jgi:hypothetical protein